MKIFSAIFYLISLSLFAFALFIASPSDLYLTLLSSKYGFFNIITTLFLTLINFTPKELFNTFKSIILSKNISQNELKYNELVINNLWKNLLFSSFVYSLLISIIYLSSSDKYILGSYFYNILSIYLFVVFSKMFIFKPIELYIKKKLKILMK